MRKAFLTPNVDELKSDNIRRFFVVPAGLAHYLTGAMEILCQEWQWEPFGSAPVKETVEVFETVLASLGNMRDIGTVYYSISPEPDEWSLEMNGQLVANGAYTELEAIIPFSWRVSGGYVLPDMMMRSLVGIGKTLSVGDAGGEVDHFLTIDEMPSHTHGYVSTQASAASLVLPDVPTAVQAPGDTAPAGGGQKHNNMPPYMAMYCYIVAR